MHKRHGLSLSSEMSRKSRYRVRRVLLHTADAGNDPNVRLRDVAHDASWKTSPSVCLWPDRITDTPCRTGAADQPRADGTGRSRVVNA